MGTATAHRLRDHVDVWDRTPARAADLAAQLAHEFAQARSSSARIQATLRAAA